MISTPKSPFGNLLAEVGVVVVSFVIGDAVWPSSSSALALLSLPIRADKVSSSSSSTKDKETDRVVVGEGLSMSLTV
jgi:hypothetical protein